MISLPFNVTMVPTINHQLLATFPHLEQTVIANIRVLEFQSFRVFDQISSSESRPNLALESGLLHNLGKHQQQILTKVHLQNLDQPGVNMTCYTRKRIQSKKTPKAAYFKRQKSETFTFWRSWRPNLYTRSALGFCYIQKM